MRAGYLKLAPLFEMYGQHDMILLGFLFAVREEHDGLIQCRPGWTPRRRLVIVTQLRRCLHYMLQYTKHADFLNSRQVEYTIKISIQYAY